MTVDEIAERLGLESPRGYVISKMKAGHFRATGRTTEMLLRALVEVAAGKRVFIAAYTPSYARDLVVRVREWAERLGLDASAINCASSMKVLGYRESHRDADPEKVDCRFYRDHFHG